jgi:hypothetical protein
MKQIEFNGIFLDKPTKKNLPTKHGGFYLKHCGTWEKTMGI